MPEPLLDELASLARTALTDPDALPDESYPDPRARIDYPIGTTAATIFAVERLDEIIETLNPSMEDDEHLAWAIEILGRHLAQREEVVRAYSTNLGDRYLEASTDLMNALDLIDSAVVALRGETDE